MTAEAQEFRFLGLLARRDSHLGAVRGQANSCFMELNVRYSTRAVAAGLS